MNLSPRGAASVGAAVVAALACSAATAQAGTNTVVFSDPGEHALVAPIAVTSLHVVAVGGAGGAGRSRSRVASARRSSATSP